MEWKTGREGVRRQRVRSTGRAASGKAAAEGANVSSSVLCCPGPQQKGPGCEPGETARRHVHGRVRHVTHSLALNPTLTRLPSTITRLPRDSASGGECTRENGFSCPVSIIN